MASPSVTQHGNFTNGSSVSTMNYTSTAITSASDCLWIAITVQKSTSATITISSITSTGVTWTKVHERSFTLTDNNVIYTTSMWKAPLGSRTTYASTTITINGSAAWDGVAGVFWATTGDATAGAGTLDPNAGLPAHGDANGGSPSFTYSTTNADDLLISVETYDNGSASLTPNTFTQIDGASIWPTNMTKVSVGQKSVSAVQTNVSVTFGANIAMMCTIFAQTADASGPVLNGLATRGFAVPMIGA